MNLISDETTLVISGAWNPAILNPGWVMMNAFPEPPQQMPQSVQASMPIGVLYAYPKYSLGEIEYTAGNDLLIIHPNTTSSRSCGLVDSIASKIIELLPHTPITGLGHNFEFREEQPSDEQLRIFTNIQNELALGYPEGYTNNSSSVTTSLTNTNKSLTINMTHYFDGSRMGIKFNFHHPIDSYETAMQVLNGSGVYGSFFANFSVAKQVIKKLYGEFEDEDHSE